MKKMDSRRTRVLFQLRFIDNEEGRKNDYTSYSTDWLEDYYADRLNYLLKHGDRKDEISKQEKEKEREEKMRRKQEEVERLEKKEKEKEKQEEKRRKIQEQLERERQEERKRIQEQKEKERLVLWRSIISLLGYDVIFQNYTRANLNGLWNGMVEEYPEITAFINQDELRIFFDQLNDVKPDPYAYILRMFAEKEKFDKLVTKNFSHASSLPPHIEEKMNEENQFKMLPLNEVYQVKPLMELSPTEKRQLEEEMIRFEEHLNNDICFSGCTPSTNDICSRCGVSIYPNEEKWEAVKGFWHQECFRCNQCNVLLDLNTYRVFDGDIWCKNHGRPIVQEATGPEVKVEPNPKPKVKVKPETPLPNASNDPLNDIFKALFNNPPVEKRKEERKEGSIFETVTQDEVNQFLNSINTSIEQATPYIQLLNAYLKK